MDDEDGRKEPAVEVHPSIPDECRPIRPVHGDSRIAKTEWAQGAHATKGFPFPKFIIFSAYHPNAHPTHQTKGFPCRRLCLEKWDALIVVSHGYPEADPWDTRPNSWQ
jgi:hypothetical protein